MSDQLDMRRLLSPVGAERFFAAVGNEDDLTGEDIDKLILAVVPMPLARPRAGRQAQQVDAELRQSRRVAEPLSLARSAGRIKGRRVERPDYRRQRGDVDPLRHCSLPSKFHGLSFLDQFEGLTARALDHDGAGAAERIGTFEKGDALATQFFDPGIEIGHT